MCLKALLHRYQHCIEFMFLCFYLMPTPLLQIGADGYVYVGRGWDWANTYANNTLAITFMGDYGRYEPNESQIEATQYLLAHAMTNKFLDLNYKIVAQNQVNIMPN